MLAFGTGLMRPILAADRPPIALASYVEMNEVDCRPYDLLFEDTIVSIILTRSCNFDSLRTWLAQNHLIPGSQAYTTVSNEVVDMINTGNFPRNPPYNPKKNKSKKEEIIGAIIQDTDGPEEDNNTINSNEEESDSGGDTGKNVHTS